MYFVFVSFFKRIVSENIISFRFDHCINNIKLSSDSDRKHHYLRSSRTSYPSTNHLPTTVNSENVYINNNNRLKPDFTGKYCRGSLDNVASLPWDQGRDFRIEEEEGPLRRTRSLAICSRQNLSCGYSEEIIIDSSPKPQLIPRARLVEKSFIKDPSKRGSYKENHPKPAKRHSKRPRESKRPKEPTYESSDHLPRTPEEKTNLNSPSYSPDYTSYRTPPEDLTPVSPLNRSPSSELEDRVTRKISAAVKSEGQYLSLDNIPWNITSHQPESFSYDENITLSKKPAQIKPKTIRGSSFYYNPEYSWGSEFDKAPSSFEFETNTNCDEIKLNNEKITKETKKPNDNNKKEACNKPALNVDKKNHTHNYIRDILETQKGSKKPLQSFITKKLTNLTRNAKSTLISNKFHSLPDITASKIPEKSEIIDKKSKKYEKTPSENRFIVNIGRHFDITAKSSIPVDFEVKIAKVSRKNKKGVDQNKEQDKELKDVVKNINNFLKSRGFSNNNVTENKDMDPEIIEKVDSVRNYWTKIIQNKPEEENKESEPKSIVNDVKKKFEPVSELEKSPSKVDLARKMFETKNSNEKNGKISPGIKDTCIFFEKVPVNKENNEFESLAPTSVEIIPQNELEDQKSPSIQKNQTKKSLTKSNSVSNHDFDYVRYKVIKPEFFKKKIITNCENESQFDGLIQYLADYSIQELLIDNNIVIIEPIRSKVPHISTNHKKPNFKNTQRHSSTTEETSNKQKLKKHFFYHPVKINKEVHEDELPNPEVVRQARQFFEQGPLKTNGYPFSKSTSTSTIDPDKDRCSITDSGGSNSPSDFDDRDEYDSNDSATDCCNEYVSEDILQKIRQYGTTVTYYGGRIVDKQNGQPILTKVIMNEIKNIEKRCTNCGKNDENENVPEIKFKLIKSNSCSSRLELTGKRSNNKQYNNKINIEKNNNTIKEQVVGKHQEKDIINEQIKLKSENLANQPRIIGEERKQNIDKSIRRFSNEVPRINGHEISHYEYQQKLIPKKRSCDMEFETYEVA